MSQDTMQFGKLSIAKLPVTEFESMLVKRLERRKLAKLRLANVHMLRMPMGGKHFGGCWVKPVAA